MSEIHIEKALFGRYIIVKGDLAWSGSRWVPLAGYTQICNFASADEAATYAKEAGLIQGAR